MRTRDKTPMVPSRQTVPNTIRTKAPASERCALGGSGGSGENAGGVTGFGVTGFGAPKFGEPNFGEPGFGEPGFGVNGLDIFHLTGRGRLIWVLRCLRRRDILLNIRRTRLRTWRKSLRVSHRNSR